ncbi:MAG: HNH endonuclease [Planctomycetaceae bacterium]|nr:HNH endonuclease [Planctomycetaceae bacterium]
MAFNRKEANQLLADCHRRCCICHKFCGVKMELDHMLPRADGGTDEIENAIPVCFECHAEIHAYNNAHPRGRKYRPEELQGHKKEWLRICEAQPSVLFESRGTHDVGPVQALVDELQFNGATGKRQNSFSFVFLTTQFERCIGEGGLSLLEDDLREAIYDAYREIFSARMWASKVRYGGGGASHESSLAKDAATRATPLIDQASSLLLNVLAGDDSGVAE